MAYAGYLIKIGGAGGTALPLRYFRTESYNVTPDQRMDMESGHDTTGYLHRNVVEHTATKIEIETVEELTDVQVGQINRLLGITSGNLRRDVRIEYYDPDTDSYKAADCYMPAIKYPIRRADSRNVHYMPIRYAFIEY